MASSLPRLLIGATAAAGLVVPLGALPAMADVEAGKKIQILGITDFHGRLDADGIGTASVIERERAAFAGGEAATTLLSAGDNIGASIYTSSAQEDGPTIDFLNALDLDASAVGNHEFDRGLDDLQKRVVPKSDFPTLGANVYKEGTKEHYKELPASHQYEVDGVKIAVIGVVTQDTASLVSPEGISGLEFGDATEAVNTEAKRLEALPEGEKPDLTIVQAHLGPDVTDTIDGAKGSNKEFAKLVDNADASVDAMFFGHSHKKMALEAPVPGTDRTRPIVQADHYAKAVSKLVLESDAEGNWKVDTNEVLPTKGEDYDSERVKKAKQVIADAEKVAKEKGSKVVGKITEDITRAEKDGKEDRGAESTLGNLVADALKEGTSYTQLGEADFGITNPGGLRTDLRCEDIYNSEEKCEVTVAELNGVLPFANDHGVVTMKGEAVTKLFEEQWQPEGASRPFLHLGISKELDVVYDSKAKAGERVKSVTVNGEKIDPKKDYKVATLSFLAAGGDNFESFATGTFEQSGMTDFEIWQKYFEENTPVSPDKKERQADAALDVIANDSVKASLTGSKDDPTKFSVVLDAKDEVKGPIVFSIDGLPEGFTVDYGEHADAKAKGARIETIPAGKSEYPFTITAPKGAKPGEHTFTARMTADEEHAFWDDNPMPLVHEVEGTVTVPGDDPTDDPTEEPTDEPTDQPTDEPSDEPTDDNGKDDDKGDDKDDDGKGKGDKDRDGRLPRTGAELATALGVALALIGAGAASVYAVRRRSQI